MRVGCLGPPPLGFTITSPPVYYTDLDMINHNAGVGFNEIESHCGIWVLMRDSTQPKFTNCVCVHACVCMYVHVHIHVHACVYVVHVCAYVCICMYMCMFMHARACICMHQCAYVCVYVCRCACVYVYMNTHACMHVCECACVCMCGVLMSYPITPILLTEAESTDPLSSLPASSS